MDDDLVLNLAADNSSRPPTKSVQSRKGGRWTDRLKVNRAAKRKARSDDSTPKPSGTEQRSKKKARTDSSATNTFILSDTKHAVPTSRLAAQVVSSLFTSNPKVEQPLPNTKPQTPSRPSNAPLTDSSSFSAVGLDPLIVAHLFNKLNVSKPTSIQRAALPALLSTTTEDTSSRDVFIQSQTGSGKTLAFLLPIIQDLLPLSSHSYIDRSIGTLAIIIAPTRELAKQISDVLESLLQLRLRPPNEAPDSETLGPRLTRWLVSGLLTGGSTRTHEKARLRKGCPILVSTPGRLLDHLQNTASFDVGKCRWLVLDEADRLMELGFEETIQGIVKGLDGRRKLAFKAVEEGKSMEVGDWDWTRRRRTVLCSATIREDVQKLAGTALVDPLIIKAVQDVVAPRTTNTHLSLEGTSTLVSASTKFTPPSQLSQKYVVVPLKLRLVTLVALIRSLLSQSDGRKGTKIIVFLSCTDSVDFHWQLLGGATMGYVGSDTQSEEAYDPDWENHENSENYRPGKQSPEEQVALQSSLLPGAMIYRLHGTLPLQTRLASLRGFSAILSDKTASTPPTPAVLFCTSVASRGLDLPLVRAVVQYDLPTESGATEYVHRVGRTARAGKGGEAWSFVSPSEVEWVRWVTEKMAGGDRQTDSRVNVTGGLEAVGMETVLRNGFGGKGTEFEERATDVQLSFERYVLKDRHQAECARKAYLSHMRAYATHPSDEKHIFHIRHLHLGHLAKAFALRDAPTTVTHMKFKGAGSKVRRPIKGLPSSAQRNRVVHIDPEDQLTPDAEKRMERVVRAQGRLTKKGGKMVSSGISDFQVASGYDLDKLFQG